jgi:CheY-like chemotaxis protein
VSRAPVAIDPNDGTLPTQGGAMTWPHRATLAPARPASSSDFSPVVILAENDRTLRDLLKESFELDRFRVLIATNGEEALTLAEWCMPDLLVTDVAMPRLDGVGLVRAIRRLYPSMPIIITSGDAFYGTRPLATAAAELGVEDTFLKPFDLGDLILAARRAVPLHADPVWRPAVRSA